MTVTQKNRYIGQLSPRQKFEKAVRTPPKKKWIKVKRIEDMEYPNARLIPIYKNE